MQLWIRSYIAGLRSKRAANLMNLRYISFGPSMDRTPDAVRYDFELHTRYISNFLSRRIREKKFQTDGSFDQIHVGLIEDDPRPPRILPLSALVPEIAYSHSDYERVRGKNDCHYYLSLLKAGFREASSSKAIPLDTLLELCSEFESGGCKNEWTHKRKRLPGLGVEVTLNCFFTTNYFRLTATIYDSKTKGMLCEGLLLETEPDEVLFQSLFKDIRVQDDNVIVTDGGDSPMFVINVMEARRGIFNAARLQDDTR